MTAKLLQFPDQCGNVAAMLRKLADEFDAGEFEAGRIALVIDTPGEIDVRGFGKADAVETLGILALGSAHLTRTVLGD